ncbi:fumarylacetoacetate hydrolase family protein [Rhizobium sp. Root1204]|uniref:fumarylacetoacetate hydrolase family protein n=1 Tax=Rhizobium sp. Root1204 TaxID=1736428 RepID=UPI0007133B3B|nr:fumarylacetoacetate hydrolase family protein [Rhizobium sp. Root1204]KQV37006.1 fumarylacetoacetate hydrolase [Rhizobium sp. Root1204]
MRLVSYGEAGKARFGLVVGTNVVDVARASEAYRADDGSIELISPRIEYFFDECTSQTPSLKKIAERAAKETNTSLVKPLSEVKILPPIARPPKSICVARNYAEHAKEAGLEISPIPILFPRFSATFVADGDPVLVPTVSDNLDWEGELAIVIGKPTNGKRITKAEAMDYVFGYTIFNDVTVRDYQFRVTQYTAGKNFRATGPIGPAIVTADEVPDPHNLDIRTTLNGEVMQFANTSTMIYDIPTILENIAEFIDLEPGDIIPTGTPAGVGFKRKPPIFLKDGDTITIEIPGIGTLSNPVKNEVAS